ncbi:hypothetical protein O181_111065 [Austropuccinia psidii MF-1]|uniref:Uncharacterized protein n=1 Tax=Austropuccinia psidii MF-1 TaxID=1389203 RepID=A0A9Q3JXP0_9BASI|nr:hypothetical protein [Austropuccinia psidii MF-1]
MEQGELKRKLEEKNKEDEQKRKEKSTSFILMDNWGGWQPPCISTGLEESFGYAYGLRNTKQRKEQEDKFKTQPKPLPSKETIQPKEIIIKNPSIPGGYIANDEPEEEGVMIPKKYKSQKAPEINKVPESSTHKKQSPVKNKVEEENKVCLKKEEQIVKRPPVKKMMRTQLL